MLYCQAISGSVLHHNWFVDNWELYHISGYQTGDVITRDVITGDGPRHSIIRALRRFKTRVNNHTILVRYLIRCILLLVSKRASSEESRNDLAEIEMTVYVDEKSACQLNKGGKLEDILVLHLEGGKDFFVSLTCKFITFIGNLSC